MGPGLIRSAITEVLFALNARFAPGAALQEMVTVQKEFQPFCSKYSLRQSHRLLHLVPSDHADRVRYYGFLDRLKRVPSDIAGMNGHDRIVKARQDNLESKSPLPIHTTTHPAAVENRVMVTQGQASAFDGEVYMIISTPVVPSDGEMVSGAPPAAQKKAAGKKSAS